MEQTSNLTQQNQPVAFTKAMLTGAVIGLAAISFFVFGVDHPNPEWGSFWQIRPLVVTPLAGATGGAFYAFMDYLSSTKGMNRTVAVVLSVIVFVVGLWLGTVLGLAGTMWN